MNSSAMLASVMLGPNTMNDRIQFVHGVSKTSATGDTTQWHLRPDPLQLMHSGALELGRQQ